MGLHWLRRLIARRRRTRPARRRPSIELLEDRCLLSGVLQFSTARYGVNEGINPAAVVVTRTGSTTGPAAAVFTTGGGTAAADADYTATSFTVSFLAGETSKEILIAVTADTIAEDAETVQLTLSNPDSATLGSPATAVLTIADAAPAFPVELRLFADATLTTSGLVGSYVNQNLRSYAPQDDWRLTQTIAGTRIDPTISFLTNSWGSRFPLGLTGGTDANWNNFSVQWDGFVQIPRGPTGLRIRSDDGSRLWIDVNGDGLFALTGPELVNNGWGSTNPGIAMPTSVPLPAGVYRMRIQYEEGTSSNLIELTPDAPEMLRVGYVIPSNRAPQALAEANLRSVLPLYQNWYRDQMERNGFGSRSFLFETMPDNVTPRIYTIFVPETDSFLRTDPFNNTIDAAQAVGVPVFDPGQDWLLIPEVHVLNPDGSLIGVASMGASFGSGTDPGVGVVGAELLPLLNPVSLADDRPYDGLIIPEIGPYPMRFGLTFPSFKGSTVSEISSSAMGLLPHEFSHGLGLAHDFRNDQNFHGNVMGNGLRGFRNFVYPERYPNDQTRITYAEALALSVSRYFNTDLYTPDDIKPLLSVTTSGAVTPAGGLVRINFTASDPSGLTAAVLHLNIDDIGELVLSGTSANTFFLTPYYTPGQANNYTVSVYDTQGNRLDVNTTITPATGVNRAPLPFLKPPLETFAAGASVTLDASLTTDPDHSAASLLVEWDLDGNGTFDTAPTTQKTLVTSFATVGTRLIRVRVTDPAGAQTVSTPLALRIVPASSPRLRVLSLDATAGGFVATFNQAIDSTVLNLYDTQAGTLRPADVTLTGPGSVAVRGSLVVDPSGTRVTFLRTGGPLAPGSYSVELRSAADGFRSLAAGELLDGDADGTAGGNYTTSFTIGAPPSATVSVPDFARGPGQSIDLPVRLGSSAGVTSVSLVVRYNPALLDISTVATAPGLPPGTVAFLTRLSPVAARINFSSPALPAGVTDFIRLTAAVPSGSAYGVKEVIDLESVTVNSAAALADDGLHAVAYLGDTTGSAGYSSADATRTLQVAVGQGSGFAAYRLLDPAIIADINGDGRVSSTDATLILREAVGFDQPQIPPLPPNPPTITMSGPDPLLFIPKTFRARPGDVLTVPVNLNPSDGLESADLVIAYDPRRLEVMEVRRGSLTADFDLFVTNLDVSAGTIRVGLGRSAGPIDGRGPGSVVEITFRIRADAPPGRATINLRRGLGTTYTQLNEGELVLTPAPDDGAGDVLDGRVTIVARSGIAEWLVAARRARSR